MHVSCLIFHIDVKVLNKCKATNLLLGVRATPNNDLCLVELGSPFTGLC